MPFVKRQQNEAADAEAIKGTPMRATMRFVRAKSEETQGAKMVFGICEFLIRQRSRAITVLRGQPGEFGQIAPRGVPGAARMTRTWNLAT